MSPSLTVAVGQAAFTIGDVDANLETIDGLVRDAVAAGAELVVAPELAVTGYTAQASSLELAEPIEGPITTRLGEIATNHGIALAVSVLEQAEDKVFDTGIILGPTGQLLARHRKTHLFGHERRIFTTGDDAVTIAPVGAFAVALLVCYEVEFPEMVRAAALAGADLVVVPTATWTYGQGSPFARQVTELAPPRTICSSPTPIIAGRPRTATTWAARSSSAPVPTSRPRRAPDPRYVSRRWTSTTG